MFSSPFMSSVALLFQYSSILISFLYCVSQSCRPYSKWDDTNGTLSTNSWRITFWSASYAVFNALLHENVVCPLAAKAESGWASCHSAPTDHFLLRCSLVPQLPVHAQYSITLSQVQNPTFSFLECHAVNDCPVLQYIYILLQGLLLEFI